MDPIYAPLVDYGIMGVFLIIVLSTLAFAGRFIIKTFRERQAEFFEREKSYEEKIEKISKRLDDYIDNDHKALIQALQNHSDAYRSQTQTNKLLLEKLMDAL